MAIEYTLLLSNRKLLEENLIKKIESIGYSCNKREQLAQGICVNLNEEIGFSVFLLNASNYAYNVWETNFLKNDFIFNQILEFKMDKEYFEFEKRYNVMLKILFDLAAESREDAILVSNGDTELCFFGKNGAILLNNNSGVWSRSCFKDIISNRDICYNKDIN